MTIMGKPYLALNKYKYIRSLEKSNKIIKTSDCILVFCNNKAFINYYSLSI